MKFANLSNEVFDRWLHKRTQVPRHAWRPPKPRPGVTAVVLVNSSAEDRALVDRVKAIRPGIDRLSVGLRVSSLIPMVVGVAGQSDGQLWFDDDDYEVNHVEVLQSSVAYNGWHCMELYGIVTTVKATDEDARVAGTLELTRDRSVSTDEWEITLHG